jgi:hypothetical protein
MQQSMYAQLDVRGFEPRLNESILWDETKLCGFANMWNTPFVEEDPLLNKSILYDETKLCNFANMRKDIFPRRGTSLEQKYSMGKQNYAVLTWKLEITLLNWVVLQNELLP